ncbi:MAG TPA: CdaR family protein [Anaerolineales bacterium]|nr:CdaR family protein [Anaerolineales bacterium]
MNSMRLASNIRTFLLALVLGIAVWVSAVSAADPDQACPFPKSIPIEIVGQEPSLVITNEIPTDMDISIRAPRSVCELLASQPSTVRAILDLSGLGAGEHEVPVKVQVGVHPTQIVLQNPKTIMVRLEIYSQKMLALTPTLNGQPAPGYRAGDAELAVKEVAIAGPKSLLDQANRARVTVSLDGVRETINESVPIQIIDTKNNVIRGLSLNPEAVEVTVPISLQGGYRDVAVNVVVQGQVAPGYRLERISVFPPVVTLLSADPAVVNALPGVVETQPLDLQDAKEDISTRLSLNLPSGITLVGAQTVQVQVSISPIQTSITLNSLPITTVGLQEGLVAEIFPSSVDVIVSGPLPVLDVLVPQDLNITVDVTGLDVGTYQLEPKVDPIDGNVTVESILPGKVEVVISVPGTTTPIPTASPGP